MFAKLALWLAVPAAFAQTPGLLERGIEAFQAGHFTEAAALLKQAVAGQPRAFEPHFLYGATLVELERPAEAIEQLEQAHRLRPRHVDVLKLLATQYMLVRDYVKSIGLLRQVPAPDEDMCLLLIESYQSSGDSATSFAFAQEALARFPKSPQLRCWLGFQLQFSGRFEDARKFLEEAARLDPAYPATYYLLADVLLKEEKYRASVPYFEKAIALVPDDVDARLGLGQAQLALGELKEAQAALEDAVKVAPEDARVHLQLSRLYFRTGDQVRAEREADLSVRLKEKQNAIVEVPASLRSGPQR
jgi:tetratricopeptide (TPR) repeat protein